MLLHADIQRPLNMNLIDFGDALTFLSALPAGQSFLLFDIFWKLLHGLAQNVVQTFMVFRWSKTYLNVYSDTLTFHHFLHIVQYFCLWPDTFKMSLLLYGFQLVHNGRMYARYVVI